MSQDGLPSPVSIRRRVGPWPIRYVFVPVLWEFLVSWNVFFFWIGSVLVCCCTLESELAELFS